MRVDRNAASASMPRATRSSRDAQFSANETSASIEADWFELFRAMFGRRSRAQIAQLHPLDPAPYVRAFTLYPPPTEPLDA